MFKTTLIRIKVYIYTFKLIIILLLICLLNNKVLANEKFNIKDILLTEQYEITYETTIIKDNYKVIEFFSANNKLLKNKIHVALINNIDFLDISIYATNELILASDIARKTKSVLVINCGYFDIKGDKIYSVGKLCTDNKLYPYYLSRQYPYFVINKDDSLDIVTHNEFIKFSSNKFKSYIQSKPLLVKDKKIPASLISNKLANTSKNPRTALGIIDKNKIICIVVEGKQDEAIGLSQVELAKLLIKLNVNKAINFDGGGSSIIVLNQQIINTPSGGLNPFTLPGMERKIHSIILFKLK